MNVDIGGARAESAVRGKAHGRCLPKNETPLGETLRMPSSPALHLALLITSFFVAIVIILFQRQVSDAWGRARIALSDTVREIRRALPLPAQLFLALLALGSNLPLIMATLVLVPFVLAIQPLCKLAETIGNNPRRRLDVWLASAVMSLVILLAVVAATLSIYTFVTNWWLLIAKTAQLFDDLSVD